MGYLLQILLAVGVEGVVEAGLERSVEWPLAVLGLALVPPLLGMGARRAALAGRFRVAGLLERSLRASPILLQLAALALFGWRRSLSSWLGEEVTLFDWPRFSLLLLFLPFVVFAALAIDARARLRAEARVRQSLRALELRMFAAGLAPLAAYVVVSAALGLSRALRVRVEEVAAFNALYTALFFALMIALLPRILRSSFDTRPLPAGGVRNLLEDVARRAHFRCRELLVWRTGNLLPNAAIIGLGARRRIVLFSDSLLGMLRPDELAAVYAHEIGHALRRHVPIFLCWTGGYFLAADLLATRIDPEGELVALGVLAAALVLWFLGFGWLSRRFELDADLFSLELFGEAESLARALEAVGGNLRDVASWRHFSVADRANFLRRAMDDAEFAHRFRKRLRSWAAAGVALLVATGAFELREVSREFSAQSAIADQRLGRDAAALERVAALAAEGRADDLERLADRAETEAAKALAENEARRALDWLRFGAHAGRARLAPAADAIEEALAGRRDRAADHLDAAPEPWSEVLEAWLGRAEPEAQ